MPNSKDKELMLAYTRHAENGASCRWCSVPVKVWHLYSEFFGYLGGGYIWECCPECGESQMTRAEGSADHRRKSKITTIIVILTVIVVIVSATFGELDLYKNWLMHLLNNLQSR